MELLILSARPRAAPARPASPDAARGDGGEGRVKPHSPAAAPVGLREPRGAPWQAGGPLPYAAVQGARGASPGRSRGRAPGGPPQPPARLVSMVHSLRAGAASRPAAASPPRVRAASRVSAALDDIAGWASSAWGGAEASPAQAGRAPLQPSAGPEDVAGWALPDFGTAPASPRRARRAGPSGVGRENSGNASANVPGRAGAWRPSAEGGLDWGAHMGVSPPAGAPDGAAQAPVDTPLGAPTLPGRRSAAQGHAALRDMPQDTARAACTAGCCPSADPAEGLVACGMLLGPRLVRCLAATDALRRAPGNLLRKLQAGPAVEAAGAQRAPSAPSTAGAPAAPRRASACRPAALSCAAHGVSARREHWRTPAGARPAEHAARRSVRTAGCVSRGSGSHDSERLKARLRGKLSWQARNPRTARHPLTRARLQATRGSAGRGCAWTWAPLPAAPAARPAAAARAPAARARCGRPRRSPSACPGGRRARAPPSASHVHHALRRRRASPADAG